MKLFRREAIQHATVRSYGEVLLSQPISFIALTAFFVAIAIIVLTFLFGFSFAQKVHVSGVIHPRQGFIRTVAPQSGLVSERRVHEGQAVKAGSVLFVVSNDRASISVDGAAKSISRLLEGRLSSLATEQVEQQRQASHRIAAINLRTVSLTKEVLRIEEQIKLQIHRVEIAAASTKRYRDLQEAEFVSPAQVQDRLADMIDQRQRLADLERARDSLTRELQSARAELNDLQIQLKRDQSAVDRSTAVVEQELVENEVKRQSFVRAPQDGVVTAITIETGQSVSAGQSLATLLQPNATLEAELYAPSRSIAYIKPGVGVLLRYQAYPHQKFGQHHGIVREVASVPLRPDEISLSGASASGASIEPLYRVRVALDNQTVRAYGNMQPLKTGMALEATIVLEKRKIYEWVLEPLYSVSGRI